ncbi:hypothetical protein C8J57DRAFT_1525961 [Mycena rebaudengoi]|nr:hypothetical protein C8J57DRAFT_1525961 [Mycena rebaudengoi]
MAADAPLADRLYTLELTLSWQYFSRPGRPLTHRMGMGALVLFDTISTLVVCATSYLAIFHGRPSPEDMILWPLSVNIFLTYSSSAVEQIFMCNIFYSLTRNLLVTVVLLTMVLAHVGLSFTSAGALLAPGVGPANMKLSVLTNMLGSILCAATDVFIALALGYKCWKIMGSLNTDDSRDTRSFLRRLFILFLSSGIIVAATTLMIMTLILTGSPAFVLFSPCQGRIYSVTILANFLLGILFHQNTSTTDPADLGSNTIVFRMGPHSDSGIFSGPRNTGTPKSTTIHPFAGRKNIAEEFVPTNNNQLTPGPCMGDAKLSPDPGNNRRAPPSWPPLKNLRLVAAW